MYLDLNHMLYYCMLTFTFKHIAYSSFNVVLFFMAILSLIFVEISKESKHIPVRKVLCCLPVL